MNFKKCFFCKQAVSFFCETYPLIVVKAINSNSESIANHCSKIRVGGKINQLGGCPPPVIEGILLTDECKQANVWIIRKFHHFKYCNTSKFTVPKSWVGGKVNQPGYVAPHLYNQEIGFCLAGNLYFVNHIH